MSIHAFRSDTAGSIGPMFAIVLIPLIGAMGIALDYSRGAMARTRVLTALDATALALARDPIVEADNSKLQARAEQIFQAELKATGLTGPTITATFGDGTIKVSGNASVPTTLTGVLGHSTIPVSGNVEVRWGTKRIDLVLALDNTGSMNDKGKLQELKKAAVDLVNSFDPINQKKADTVRIGVVPFTTAVKVPAAYQNQSWFARYKDGELLDKAPKNNWNGCVLDRDQSNDVSDTPPNGVLSTKFPAPVDDSECDGLKEIQPLTTNFGQIRSTINSMNADGYTNVTIGLAWGWHAVSTTAPMTEGRDQAADKDLLKIVILLTDGDNTRNRWTSTQSKIDARTKLACDNIKAAGVLLYTIRLIDGNTSLLESCATDKSKFYNASSAGELSPVFARIASDIGGLRLSK